jgi:Protein of unknown function (DUF2802)
MFEILPNPSFDTVLIVLRGALLVGAFWIFAVAFTRWRRSDERDAQRLHAQLERAFAELRSLHETVSVMSARIESLGERVESEPRIAPVSVASASRGYDLATRLAKNGADVEQLVATCGITRHEAELLARLHGAQRREAAAVREQPAAPRADTPAQTWPMQQAAQPQPKPQQSGRKRGSLLSVVG